MKSIALPILLFVFSSMIPLSAILAAETNFESSASSAVGNLLDDKHKLVPGDKISFQILEDKNPVKSLMVTDSGEVNFPYIGRVAVANKTCQQIAQEIKMPLERDYYYHATVIVGLDEASKVIGRIYVVGQVRLQGAIEIPSEEDFT